MKKVTCAFSRPVPDCLPTKGTSNSDTLARGLLGVRPPSFCLGAPADGLRRRSPRAALPARRARRCRHYRHLGLSLLAFLHSRTLARLDLCTPPPHRMGVCLRDAGTATDKAARRIPSRSAWLLDAKKPRNVASRIGRTKTQLRASPPCVPLFARFRRVQGLVCGGVESGPAPRRSR